MLLFRNHNVKEIVLFTEVLRFTTLNTLSKYPEFPTPIQSYMFIYVRLNVSPTWTNEAAYPECHAHIQVMSKTPAFFAQLESH